MSMTTAVVPTVNVVSDPRSGEILTADAGTYLQLRFARKGIALSEWRIADRPGHLLPIEEGDHVFTFLVFGDEAPQPLRLARYRGDRVEPSEERELFVVPAQR
ncbi:hypothetical protein [Nocardioides sp.]|uniref:hypothetical protein n=1 Tax=Nocardioides sp. TaxID=35761 RepID=UPI0039E6B7DE